MKGKRLVVYFMWAILQDQVTVFALQDQLSDANPKPTTLKNLTQPLIPWCNPNPKAKTSIGK